MPILKNADIVMLTGIGSQTDPKPLFYMYYKCPDCNEIHEQEIPFEVWKKIAKLKGEPNKRTEDIVDNLLIISYIY